MTSRSLVPADFDVPNPPDHPLFRFEPVGPEHNTADLDAWSSSIDHIHSTPGFRPDGWPGRQYTLAENMADLEKHRDHHQRGIDFAWTVLDPIDTDVVIGCVYLKPDPTKVADAEARSWVRADRAARDHGLARSPQTVVRQPVAAVDPVCILTSVAPSRKGRPSPLVQPVPAVGHEHAQHARSGAQNDGRRIRQQAR